jgi:hypothetical protein
MLQPVNKLAAGLTLGMFFALWTGCSDDDGSDVPRNGPIGSGGSVGGSAGAAGSAGAGASAGSGGAAGSSGAAGSGGAAGTGGAAGCPNVPDAGAGDAGVDAGGLDAGALDAGGLDASAGDASSDGSQLVSFARDIQPIFAQRCGPCHVSDGSAGHNVGSSDLGVAYADAVEQGQTLFDRINGGGMPPSFAEPPNNCANGAGPGDPGCVTIEELELVQAWITQCNPR